MRRVILVFVGMLLLTAGCDSLDNKVTIQYRVTGAVSSVDLTYENRSGNTEQISEAPLPWSYEFTAEIGDFVYVSAQNNDDSGIIRVEIKSEGRVIEEATSSGAFVIATASGSAR